MNKPSDSLATRWRSLTEHVAEIASRCGRAPQEVCIIGVTKYVDVATTRELVLAGAHDVGESRPQSLWEKSAALTGLPCRWHLIGPLQRNKVRRTLPHVHLIHSIDSLKLAYFIDNVAAELGLQVKGLIEVNISGDASKQGVPPDQFEEILGPMEPLQHLRICGLMGMSGLGDDAREISDQFERLRNLRDKAIASGTAGSLTLKELSMGMSNDFPLAIAQGATMIRVGSRLFP
jgi:pyridoxal phosphate enzyme (YggS family)